MNVPMKICPCCGTLVEVSRAEAIEAQVATWRAWCAENNVQLIPGDLVKEDLAAELVGTIGAGTLKNKRYEGKRPEYVKRGKTPLYALHMLAAWIIDGCP